MNFTNVIGQKEDYLDPKDKEQIPVFTRLVVADKENFLPKNLKTLVNSKNEYYPYITGVCLCSKCACGNCKCVHFKYKVPENNNEQRPTSAYKEDFKPHVIEPVECRIAYPELMTVPT